MKIFGGSGILKLNLQYFAQIPERKFTEYALDFSKDPNKARAFRDALGYTKDNGKNSLKILELILMKAN